MPGVRVLSASGATLLRWRPTDDLSLVRAVAERLETHEENVCFFQLDGGAVSIRASQAEQQATVTVMVRNIRSHDIDEPGRVVMLGSGPGPDDVCYAAAAEHGLKLAVYNVKTRRTSCDVHVPFPNQTAFWCSAAGNTLVVVSKETTIVVDLDTKGCEIQPFGTRTPQSCDCFFSQSPSGTRIALSGESKYGAVVRDLVDHGRLVNTVSPLACVTTAFGRSGNELFTFNNRSGMLHLSRVDTREVLWSRPLASTVSLRMAPGMSPDDIFYAKLPADGNVVVHGSHERAVLKPGDHRWHVTADGDKVAWTAGDQRVAICTRNGWSKVLAAPARLSWADDGVARDFNKTQIVLTREAVATQQAGKIRVHSIPE